MAGRCGRRAVAWSRGGVVLGIAGTFAPSASLRPLAWGLDGTSLVVASALLAVYHWRRGTSTWRPLSEPLPFFAYPFLAATLLGWACVHYRGAA